MQAPGEGFLVSADPATNTIYAANTNLPQIDVLNGATCRTGNLTGCAPVAKIPMADPFANIGTIDPATHTMYASDPFSDTVSVINTATCNAADTSGCAQPSPAITVGPGPGPPALNPVTRTLYVPYGMKGSRVGVVNAATCNATDTSGCGQVPAVVSVGQCTFSLAVSSATDTVYAPSAGSVASNCTDGDTVPVINGATCNGTNTEGCGAHFPVMPAGRSPVAVTLDATTGFVYVADFSSAAVSVLNGSRCNAETAAVCGAAAREQPVGSGPQGITLNQRTHTVYVAEIYQPGFMSIFTAAQH